MKAVFFGAAPTRPTRAVDPHAAFHADKPAGARARRWAAELGLGQGDVLVFNIIQRVPAPGRDMDMSDVNFERLRTLIRIYVGTHKLKVFALGSLAAQALVAAGVTDFKRLPVPTEKSRALGAKAAALRAYLAGEGVC